MTENKKSNTFAPEAQEQMQPKKGNKWLLPALLAICLFFPLLRNLPTNRTQNNGIELSKLSHGVKAKYIKQLPDTTCATSYDLQYLTEEELFSTNDTTIIKGVISNIQNIQLDFHGEKLYWAIAKVKVQKVYRGNCKVDDTITLRLQCPINIDAYVEETETISSMKEGMTGIFMPIQYDDTSDYSENDATLHLKDIADYGFLDGLRYAFLASDNGLIFDKTAYQSIENAKTLDDIEQYVQKMIGSK